jgi:hypothetical protein
MQQPAREDTTSGQSGGPRKPPFPGQTVDSMTPSASRRDRRLQGSVRRGDFHGASVADSEDALGCLVAYGPLQPEDGL